MVLGTKRKRASAKGLPPGERLQRDKISGAELFSQWGWVSRVTDTSQITSEHRLAACGFIDKFGRPICRNKYSELDQRERKKRRLEVAQETDSKPIGGEDVDDIIVISSDEDNQYICNKKECKENPQCVNYLGQTKLENHDAALQSYLELSNLGTSPLGNAREPDLPVGLKVWFQDHAFRDGVYKCKPSQEEGKDLEDSPIFQLQVTFAALQESTQSVFNPAKLVESLQLRASEQQDAQEFSKLFMSHLATQFEKQAVPSLKTLLADQFEGKQTYGTLCKKCQVRSEQDADFLELEINLEANGKLEERIRALLQSEELTGDNKYYCTRCDSLQDAVRYTKLRKLPPVLHFSVLRFVFDVATLSRKKSKYTILFPSVLDMTPFLDVQSASTVQVPSKRRPDNGNVDNTADLVYELRGVLLHKGPSAYHGHYEAQVFDVTKKQFYQFNDETVTPITSLQGKKASVGQEAGRSKIVDADKKRRTHVKKKMRVDDSDCEIETPIHEAHDLSKYISSKDAYMLIYARRETKGPNPFHQQLPEPPALARKRVAQLNEEHDVACATYTNRETELTKTFNLMRQKKSEIYRHWNIGDFREESAVVSRSALEEWLAKDIEIKKPLKETSDELSTISSLQDPDPTHREPKGTSMSPVDSLDLLIPTPPLSISRSPAAFRLDNSSIVCQHGALDPMKVNAMKRIKKEALISIRTETNHFFDPELTTEDVCQTCVKEIFLEKRYTLDHSSQVEQFDELCDHQSDAEGAWISKAWLRDWRKAKPKMHLAGKPDPNPEAPEFVAHVRCTHGQLSTSSLTRKWLNAEACTFLQSLFPSWNPLLSRLDSSRTCIDCDKDQVMSKEAKIELKTRVDREKDKLKRFLLSNVLAMEPELIPGTSQALISADFLRQWRAWINRPHDKPRPNTIDNSALLCEHNLLIIDPTVQEDLGTLVAMISLDDWKTFQDLYGGGPLVTVTSPTIDSTEVVLNDNLKVCQGCRTDRLGNFDSATISVRLLEDKTPETQESLKEGESRETKMNETLGASRGRKDGRPLRTSNRLRSSKRKEKCQSIMIEKMSTIKDIKIMLQEELGIPTICQRLYFKGKELIDNSETVASLGILRNDTLELREEKEDDDAMNSDLEDERTEGRAFGGTVLSGGSRKTKVSPESERLSSPEVLGPSDRHCLVCTFINTEDVSNCEMCGSKFEDQRSNSASLSI